MASRWDVTKAVRASGLSAAARLILLVLADVAEVGTAEIPERFTPSLTVLERETGLSRSTIKRQLAGLEAAGWVVRTYPEGKAMRRGERIRYRLEVPSSGSTVDTGVGSEGGSTVNLGGVHSEPTGGSTVNPPIRSVSDLSDREPSALVREDVETVCVHLADRIEANGSRRPKITQEWRTQARLLLDADGRTVDQVLKAIDWCQSDPFWRGNVLSMPTLRKQYDRLRLAAQRASPAKPATSDVKFAAAIEAGQRARERIEAQRKGIAS